jgi:hypothetical protein
MVSTKHKLPKLDWKIFNALRKMQFLQVSYLVLVGVPIYAAIQHTSFGQFFGEMPITLRLGYFAALVLSIAHMIYQACCPEIVKRFDSPNDLYRNLLEIKALQVQCLPNDPNFDFSIEHCRDNFKLATTEKWLARLVCAFFYGAGLSLLILLFIERSWLVLF